LDTNELRRWYYGTRAPARYVRAFDVNAEKKIRETIKWRKERKPQLISPESIRVQLERGESILCGFDKEGNGIIYFRLDFRDCTSEEKVDMVIFSMERNMRYMVSGEGGLCVFVR
jgi:hypothetical protein